MDWLSRSGNRISIDIETQGDADVLHPRNRPLICVGMFNGREAGIIPRDLLGPVDYEGGDHPWPELLYALADKDLELHGGIFDIPTLACRLGEQDVNPEDYGVQVGFDTMLSHYTIRPAAEQGLKPLAKSLMGVDDWDQISSFPELADALFDSREDWWRHVYPVMEALCERPTRKMDMTNLASYPDFLVQLYNAYDVLYTWMFADWLRPYLDHSQDSAKASTHLHEFVNDIMWDQLGGFPVDTDRAEQIVAMLEEQIQRHKEVLQTYAHTVLDPNECPGGVFNPNSPKQVQWLYRTLGVKLTSTNKKTMTKLAKQGDQFAAEMLLYRSVVKENGTYAKKAAYSCDDHTGEPVLYPWYRPTRTLTGRLSSSGVTNMQNWPKQGDAAPERRLRSVFVPTRLVDRPRVLTQVDYSQAELRVMAAESGDDWLTSIFEDATEDIFTMMTRQIFPDLADEEEVKLWRKPLKSVVYGLAFGRQAQAIADELKIPLRQAQGVMSGFLGLADDLDLWLKDVARRAIRCEALVTRFGRHFQHEIITPRNKADVQRSALSFIPQSTASDITLRAYMDLRTWLRTTDLDWHFRALVHDAITYDVPVEEVEFAEDRISHFMIQAARRVMPEVPFAVDAKHATDWSRTG